MDNTPKEGEERPLRRIRSFSVRSGKISPLQKRSLERLSPLYCIPLSPDPIDFSSLFGPGRPLILEIGFGMGLATAEIAQKFPGKDFLGVEVHSPGVGKLLSEIERRGLSNVRIVQADVVDVLRDMIPDGRLSGVHMFFADPWPKKRHHKSRLFTEGFAGTLSAKLMPGGYIYLVTDIEDYAEVMLAVGASVEGLINPSGGYAPRLDFRPDTAFEKKAQADGRPVREILFVKK